MAKFEIILCADMLRKSSNFQNVEFQISHKVDICESAISCPFGLNMSHNLNSRHPQKTINIMNNRASTQIPTHHDTPNN